MQSVRDLIAADEESFAASTKTLLEFKEEFITYRANSDQSMFNLAALTQEHSEKIETEANKRRTLHGMLDEMCAISIHFKLLLIFLVPQNQAGPPGQTGQTRRKFE